jgi:hypothetical protein
MPSLRRWTGTLAVLASAACAHLCSADEGLRTVDVRRYGIHVQVPQAWRLIEWASNDTTFVLESYPEAIRQEDPQAEVICKLVPQGTGVALETVIHTRRGPFAISILERRFQGLKRNYDVKFTCETAAFKRVEAELRKSLESFRELQNEPERTIL